MARLRDVGKS